MGDRHPKYFSKAYESVACSVSPSSLPCMLNFFVVPDSDDHPYSLKSGEHVYPFVPPQSRKNSHSKACRSRYAPHDIIMAENSGCLLSELFPKLLKKLFISNGVIQIIEDITCLQGFYYWQVWSSVHCTFWNLIYQTEIQFSNWEGSDHKLGEYLECQSQIFFSICDNVCDM